MSRANHPNSPLRRRAIALLGLLPSMLLGACAQESTAGVDDSPTAVHLAAQRALWRQLKIDDYQFSQRRLCGECPLGVGSVPYEANWRVSVTTRTSPVVSAASDPSSGTPYPSARLNEFRTVEQLFDLVEQAIAQQAHRLSVSYDPQHAFPASISIDWFADPNIADDETVVISSGFQTTN